MAPISRKCWRCHGEGFVRGPCQACGALRTNTYANGVLVSSEVVYMAGSVWGEAPPPIRPKPKLGRRDR